MHKIDINPKFEKVLDFINQTNQNIFLTGKAGTGKTTLLKYIREKTFKQLAVVAPTGVAAINAGGSTIHSFFQFPFTPFLPILKDEGMTGLAKNNPQTLKYNSQRLAIFKSLELLIIDEISMVRADLLDQIDQTLRVVRRRSHLPFGGVQVMLVGDMFQLPPVVQQEEWQLLSTIYKSPFFFDSLVIRNHAPVYIELDKIYRQSERDFVDLLNKVRDNKMDVIALELLNSHFKNNITDDERRTQITLTTHNRKADEINQRNLEELPGKAYQFKAKLEGVFPEKNYPVDEILKLKVGCRVMFLKNNAEKNYFNGKIGLVIFLSDDKIKVRCPEDHSDIEVIREEWTNVAFKADKTATHIEEEILGTFSHFPLRLAWAITIHKSQGLTFDQLIIDAAEAFSAGQVYVALSRCRSLSGLTLSTKIRQNSLLNDSNILGFSDTRPDDTKINEMYGEARTKYLRQIISDIFDLSNLLRQRQELGGVMQNFRQRFNKEGQVWFASLAERIDLLHDVSLKFHKQLQPLLDAASNLERDLPLQDRIKQASTYFASELSKCVQFFETISLITESRDAAESFEPLLNEFYGAIFFKESICNLTSAGFDFGTYIKSKMQLKIPVKKFNIFVSAANVKVTADLKHPALFKTLILLRDEIVNENHLPVHMVANVKTLTELANYLPDTEEKLLKISGFGQKKVEQLGDQFLKVIRQYLNENNLQSQTEMVELKKTAKKREKSSEKTEKKSTYDRTIEMYRSGKTPNDIALERQMTVSTIQAHLLRYIQSGEIPIRDLVEPNKIKLIEKAILEVNYEEGMSAIKMALPDEISYAEIKFVMAHRANVQ